MRSEPNYYFLLHLPVVDLATGTTDIATIAFHLATCAGDLATTAFRLATCAGDIATIIEWLATDFLVLFPVDLSGSNSG